jgi:hypothetical protein
MRQVVPVRASLRTRTKVALSALAVGALGSFAALGVYGLFTATTQNSGNEIASGTVELTDNDSGSALYNVTGARPGDATTKCIKTTYAGSIAAIVELYSPGSPGPLAQYIDLTITQGTQESATFPGCTGFTADATGVIYSGTLQSFEQTHGGYSTGIATVPAGQTAWGAGTSLVFRFQVTLQAAAPDASQGWSSGVHSFVWEARNQ